MNDIFKIDHDKLRIETILDKSVVHLIIPEGIKSIGLTAFEGCNKLEQVDLPASIAVIGDLQSCPSLRCIKKMVLLYVSFLVILICGFLIYRKV